MLLLGLTTAVAPSCDSDSTSWLTADSSLLLVDVSSVGDEAASAAGPASADAAPSATAGTSAGLGCSEAAALPARDRLEARDMTALR